MTTSVRAEIIIGVKDEASKPLAKVGESGTSALKDLNRGASDVIQRFTGLNVASLGAAAAIGGLAAGLHYAVQQAAEAEKIMAVTGAVVKATGGAAGLTAEQIAAMAGRLSQLNAVDDEVIQSAQNVLLTFKKIKGEAFEQASQAALDLSVVMGGDWRGAMMMVGKALEDPVRGITALRRAGVSFTADQQALIKSLVETGQQAKAMDMILAELNSQVGGAGVAAANTYAGQVALLKINIDNLAQSVGEGLIPPLTEATKALNLLITWQGNVDAALAEHQATVLVTAQSYDAYIAEIERAQIASGNYYRDQNDVVRSIHAGSEALEHMTRSQYLVERGLALVTDRTEDYHGRLDATTRAMDTSTTATSDLAHGYARMGEEANNMSDAMVKINEDLAKQSAFIHRALDAGLDGKIQGAMDDYKDVLAETQPEIDKLTADIARMNAAHGQTFTMVDEAKHSVEEYELAQIKSATAAQKLAEFTGDSREEYLQLKIAADEAAQRVGTMGTEMGITQQFTADYTQRLLEANGQLSELEAKQLAAEEAMRRATAEMLYQTIAAELDGEAALKLARELGLVTEADYIAATAAMNLAKGYDGTRASADLLATSTGILRDTINALQDKNITITISTVHKEYYEQMGWRPEHEGDTGAGGEGGYNGGGGGGATGDDGRDNRAGGGWVSAGHSYLVGEQGRERFTPATDGYITPNAKLGEGGGMTVNVTVNMTGGDARAISAQIAGELRRALRSGVAAVGA